METQVNELNFRADRTVTVQPGTYYLCDPCYAVTGSEWMGVLDASNYLTETYAEGNRGIIVAFGTEWGDGYYEDQFGNGYPVDAGLIGLVDVRYNDKPNMDGLRVVTFTEPTVCTSRKRGRYLTFGETVIDTNPDMSY